MSITHVNHKALAFRYSKAKQQTDLFFFPLQNWIFGLNLLDQPDGILIVHTYTLHCFESKYTHLSFYEMALWIHFRKKNEASLTDCCRALHESLPKTLCAALRMWPFRGKYKCDGYSGLAATWLASHWCADLPPCPISCFPQSLCQQQRG